MHNADNWKLGGNIFICEIAVALRGGFELMRSVLFLPVACKYKIN